LSAPTGK